MSQNILPHSQKLNVSAGGERHRSAGPLPGTFILVALKGALTMTGNSGNKTNNSVTLLSDSPEYQPSRYDRHGGQYFTDPTTGVFDCLLANPKFSRPANDDRLAHDRRFAPVNRMCREARLVRLWAETLAESDRERA